MVDALEQPLGQHALAQVHCNILVASHALLLQKSHSLLPCEGVLERLQVYDPAIHTIKGSGWFSLYSQRLDCTPRQMLPNQDTPLLQGHLHLHPEGCRAQLVLHRLLGCAAIGDPVPCC